MNQKLSPNRFNFSNSIISKMQRQHVTSMQTSSILRSALSRPAALLAAAVLLIGLSAPTFAQANNNPPTKLTYQGFLTDQNGVPQGNTGPINKTIIFKIFDALTAGNRLWASQQTVTIDKGHFSVLLGEGSAVGSEPFNADLTSYFTGTGASDRFLELTVDGTPIAPRLQFFPSPYAMLATVARRANELDGGGVTSGTVADARLSANVAKLNTDQTFTGANTFGNGIRINGNKTIQLGADSPGREVSAGQIGYGTHSFGNSLDIVGAGTTSGARKIQMWAEGGMQINGPVTATSYAGYGAVPLGGIIMWSGAINTIPAGWALCNGQTVNGRTTPNLQDRFVIGAGSGYGVGAAGGNAFITLSVSQLPPHSHNLWDAYFAEYQNGNWGYAGSRGGYDTDNQPFSRYISTENTGSGAAIDIRPPYYALAFIMRVN
jgi:hypothetical protein